MWIYFSIGLWLLVLNTLFYVKLPKKNQIWGLLLGFLFFSGALMAAQGVMAVLFPDINCLGDLSWLRGDGFMLQYRSALTALRWVPVQYIFPCLAGVVFLHYRKAVELYVWMLLPVFLYSSFSFVGVCGIALWCAAVYLVKKEIRITQILSLSNIGTAVTLGSVLVLYFWGNISAPKPKKMAMQVVAYDSVRLVCAYLLFCFFLFGLHSILIWKRNRTNPVFTGMIAILLLLPFWRMGTYNDWVMGCSIVPMFFLMLFVWEFLFREDGGKIRKRVLIILLCIGAVYPAIEMARAGGGSVLKFTRASVGRADDFGTLERYANRKKKKIRATMKYQYFTYDLEDDLFYRYLARKQYEPGEKQ